jgi:hypothetical protein
MARNQDNESEWGEMSIHGLLFQLTSTIKIKLSVTRGEHTNHDTNDAVVKNTES